MALDPVPWFMGGGAEHSPEVARMLAYAATSGSEGVISPNDLRVTALPTPGAAVRVYPGGAALLNRYPGAPNQTYTVRNASSTDVAVSATGSSGAATRYVILRVDDPQYGGQAPANPVTGPYVRFALVNSISNLAYPFIVLARIEQPANTAAITGSMIKDMRRVSNPRTKAIVQSGAVTPEVRMQNATGMRWPSFQPMVEVPEWATYMTMVATISAVGHLGGDAEGTLTATLGEAGASQFRAPNTFYDLEQGPWEGERHAFVIGGEGPVHASLRGTTQRLATEGRFMAGPGYLITKGGTHVIYQVQFQELAD